MSTKIYNGYRVDADSLEQAVKIIFSFKKEAKEFAYEMALTEYTKEAVEIFDSNILALAGLNNIESAVPSSSALSINFSKKWDELAKEPEHERKIDLNIILYPQKFTVDNKSFFIFTAHMPSSAEKWMSEKYKNKIKEFGYWDNTDRPEEVTSKEWTIRKKCWQKALLNSSGIPMQEGMNINLASVDKLTFSYHKEREEKIQDIQSVLDKNISWSSPEKRVKKFVNEKLTEKVFQSLLPKDKKDSDHSSLSIYMKADRMVRTNEIDAALLEEKEQLTNSFSNYIFVIKAQDLFENIENVFAEKSNNQLNNTKKLKP